MAFKPMSPNERASIEAQVCLKAAVELAVAEKNSGDEGVAVTMAIENAEALALALPALKATLEGSLSAAPPAADTPDYGMQAAQAIINDTFEGTTEVQPAASSGKQSMYIDDEEYNLVHKIFLAEKQAGIAYASKDSMFMDNQAVRKLFQAGIKQFPADYWAESMRGVDIPTTKTGKCGLGDFKIKKGTSLDAEGNPVLGQGDGNHPLANKSGYFGGLVKHTPFNWGERPAPVDPNNWLAKVDA